MIRDRKRLFENKKDTFEIKGLGKCTFDIDIENDEPDFNIEKFDGWRGVDVEITARGSVIVSDENGKRLDLGDIDDDGNEYCELVQDELQDYFRNEVSSEIYVELDDDGNFTISYEAEYEIEDYVKECVEDDFYRDFDRWM